MLEAVGFETGRAGDGGWSGWVDETVALLREAQDEDGYLNSWIQGVHPEQRWQNLNESHELYCAGHLIQAAVAVARGAGRDDLLDVARRFADLAVQRFGADGGEPGLDGHPEVETALVELSRPTGDARYLALATAMVERRGRGLLGRHHFGPQYLQDHAARARGHRAGRACGAPALSRGRRHRRVPGGAATRRCSTRWSSCGERTYAEKTYVTGAHGSRHRDEAFGDPYELPPDRAYGETCAAIASFIWNWRLLLATGDGRYAEEMERALYNAIAVSTALDGCHFSYSNPLHLRDGHDGADEDAPSERLPWFRCAVLPAEPRPARRARCTTTSRRATAAASSCTSSRPAASRARRRTAARRRSPCRPATRGTGAWRSRGEPGERMDAVAAGPRLVRDARRDDRRRARRGDGRRPGLSAPAARVERPSQVVLELPMPVRVIAPHPRIDAVRGCVALARGPLVYCIEQADHPAASRSRTCASIPPRRPRPPAPPPTSASR